MNFFSESLFEHKIRSARDKKKFGINIETVEFCVRQFWAMEIV